MSLVAYGDSDSESDPDDAVSADAAKPSTGCVRADVNVVGSKPFLPLPPPESQITRTSDGRGAAEADTTESKNHVFGRSNVVPGKPEECPLFPALPKPKASGKVKITIPSLNEVPICDFTRKTLRRYLFLHFQFYDEDDDYQPKRKVIKPSNVSTILKRKPKYLELFYYIFDFVKYNIYMCIKKM